MVYVDVFRVCDKLIKNKPYFPFKIESFIKIAVHIYILQWKQN